MSLDTLVIRPARGFRERLLGLMFRDSLDPDTGLLLTPCTAVHTCFMRFALDLVYLDERARITRLVVGLRPWRFSLGGRKTAQTLELPSGSIARWRWRVGDSLAAHPVFAVPNGRRG